MILSGSDDPVGNMGKGVQAFYKQLKTNGLQQVRMELFSDARHDLLHEEKSGVAARVREMIREWMLIIIHMSQRIMRYWNVWLKRRF